VSIYLAKPSGAIVRNRSQFMAYRQLRDGLEVRDLLFRDSARFGSSDDDLLDKETRDRRAEAFHPARSGACRSPPA
jgi:hypothetical protein